MHLKQCEAARRLYEGCYSPKMRLKRAGSHLLRMAAALICVEMIEINTGKKQSPVA